ncbi:hypothetical protein, partial [Neisseria sicca]|uniref:hypothetical protein n=1 Tax=Neisseria sicca TaxID=490 RepID=UPI001C99C770
MNVLGLFLISEGVDSVGRRPGKKGKARIWRVVVKLGWEFLERGVLFWKEEKVGCSRDGLGNSGKGWNWFGLGMCRWGGMKWCREEGNGFSGVR